MADDGKKISFGFSKIANKKTLFKKETSNPSVPNVQYIDCLDSKAIKVKTPVGPIINKETDLVIPLSKSSPFSKNSKLREIIGNGVSQLPTSSTSDSVSSTGDDLESIAIRELLEDVKKSSKEKETPHNLIVELPQAGAAEIDQESTLKDYETVPVANYGLAMLRGMGWDATKGMGKSEKIVAPVEIKVRPRGMGLGVELPQSPKVSSTQVSVTSSQSSVSVDEELKITKGCYVQVTNGSKKDMYGQIEGFNEETGRFILKMALGGSSLSVNGYMVKPVTQAEYNQNSRVLNAAKYKEYKDKEVKQESNGLLSSSGEEKRKHSGERGERRDRSNSPTRKKR